MEEELEFPSSDELVVAETLLLLCCKPPSPSLPSERKRESSQSLELSDLRSDSVCISKSCASSSSAVTWDDDRESAEAQSHPCRMRLQVVRKKRSLMSFCISEDHKSCSENPVKETSVTMASASSCLSNDSASSTISSAVSRGTARIGKWERTDEVLKQKKPSGSTHIRRRAEAIINILSDCSTSEVRIRQLLGDSPDTSKALRLLLKLDQVTRSGAGGHKDPYIYMIA